MVMLDLDDDDDDEMLNLDDDEEDEPPPRPQRSKYITKWAQGTKFSEDDFWTPQGLFDVFAQHYGPVDVDAAASPVNAKAPIYLTAADNALARPWPGRVVWCNPPYERKTRDNDGMGAWAAKAHAETQRPDGPDVVLLLVPCYSDSAVFHVHVLPHAAEIIFVRSRIQFEGPHVQPGGSSRNPSMLVVYRRAGRSTPYPEIGWCYRTGDEFTPPSASANPPEPLLLE